MKKHLTTLALCVFTLLCVTLSAFGSASQNNTVLTKSYLEGTYWRELQGIVSERAAASVGNLAAPALKRLEELGRSYVTALVPEDNGGASWLTASGYVKQGGETGDSITLAAGSGIVWQSGSAAVTGKLIDLTDARELTGGALTENHRYVAAEESVITVSSRVAYWSAEGRWQTTSDGVDESKLVFIDIPTGIWYEEPVYFAVDKGLFIGVDNTPGRCLFGPLGNINRCQMATLLYRMHGSPEVSYRPVYSDVPDGQFYSVPCVWAGDNGITQGVVEGSVFEPIKSLSRQEVVAMLYHYAAFVGYDTSARTDLTVYPDHTKVGQQFYDAMSWAVSTGIVLGGDGKLGPEDDTNRAQVAAILQRYYKYVVK